MKPAIILDSIRNAGLVLSLLPGDLLKVEPKEKITDEIRQTIKEHKAELIRLLSGGLLHDDQDTPIACRGCPKSETITIEGQPAMPGCVRRLDTGPWSEVWHRLPADLKKCILH
ncbi:MAG: hypothetical protein P4L42_03390 [Desulfocapsaceae bacterium]|nr:hypothetical protein [Desulfocapsaceae bacterium]